MSNTVQDPTVTRQQLVNAAVAAADAAKAAPTVAEAAPHLEAAGQYTHLLMQMGLTAEQFAALVATARGDAR